MYVWQTQLRVNRVFVFGLKTAPTAFTQQQSQEALTTETNGMAWNNVNIMRRCRRHRRRRPAAYTNCRLEQKQKKNMCT